MAEYRELPRIVNGVLEHKFVSQKIPPQYVLGKGHVIFFTNKLFFLAKRYEEIFNELKFIEFSLNSQFAPADTLKKMRIVIIMEMRGMNHLRKT